MTRKLLCIWIVLTLVTALAGCADEKTANTGQPITTVTFFDVGQADCALIEYEGSHILIDAGNNADGTNLCRPLQQKKITTIDILVGTHPHEDHIGGLDDVIETFQIQKLYLPKVKDSLIPTTQTYEDVLDAAAKKGLTVSSFERGQPVWQKGNASFTFLGPVRDDYDNLNEYSLICRLDAGKTSFLFMGDAEAKNEEELLESGAEVKADVLKVGHHGSQTSSGNAFLKAVNPQYAVISCGIFNEYGHPSNEVLLRLMRLKTKIVRTDEQSSIVFTTNGEELTFDCEETLEPTKQSHTGASSIRAFSSIPADSSSAAIASSSNEIMVQTVYKTETGKSYHKQDCSYLTDSAIPLTLEEAKTQGLAPCKRCFG